MFPLAALYFWLLTQHTCVYLYMVATTMQKRLNEAFAFFDVYRYKALSVLQ